MTDTHIFKDGDVLYAKELNDMQERIDGAGNVYVARFFSTTSPYNTKWSELYSEIVEKGRGALLRVSDGLSQNANTSLATLSYFNVQEGARFVLVVNGSVISTYFLSNNNVWETNVYNIEDAANKKTTITDSSTDYPTTGAVKNALAACDKVFIAYWNCSGKVDTIYTEIQAAVNAGKIAVLYYADSEWSMLCTNDAGEGGAFGFSNTEATSSVISYIGDDDVWHRESYNLEETANKKTTLTNSDTDYPTTKAVKDVTDDLSERITNISTIGRFLSVWSLAGGLPLDNPTTPLPYAYRRGDYYIADNQVVEGKAVTVGGKVFQPLNNITNGRRQYQRRYGPGSAVESRFFPEGSTPAVGDTMFTDPGETTPTGGTVTAIQDSFALIPTGDSYTGAASTVHASGFPAANTMFVYTGTGWVAVNAQGQTVAFANIAGQPTDNAALTTALNGKQDTINDLATIREGAALGATALQSVPNTYRTSAAQDVIDATKQDILVSGTNIKTINNASLLGSGNIDTSGVFVATYNVTPYADVLAAYNAGKVVVCSYLNNQYIITRITDQLLLFSARFDAYQYTLQLTSSNVWTFRAATFQGANLVTTLSASSDNTHYPSAKCVYDYVGQQIGYIDASLANIIGA